MKNKVLVLMLILFVSGITFAQLDRTKQPAPGPAPEIKIADSENFTLKNGLKVFVVRNTKLPRVAFNLVIDRDPIVEGENAGYVETAGQLLRTGTKTRTKDKLDEEIDFIGANLSTSSTGVYAASLKKHVNKLLELMSDVVLNPNFKQEELDKIQKQTLSGLAAAKDDPNAISTRVRDILFYGKDHPYGEATTEQTVKKINLEMTKKYIDDYFRPNAAYLAIVGDITKAEAQKLIEKYFGKWQSKEIPKNSFTTPKSPVVNKVCLVDRPASVQSVLTIGYPVELRKGSDDVIKASMLNMILGGSFSSRLNQNLREKHGYTYGARSAIASDKYIGHFEASTTVRNSVTDSAITEMLSEIKKIRTEKIEEAELQSTKNYMTGNFARALESPQTIANFAIDIERYQLPKDYYKNYLKNLNAVTSDEMLATAKKYVKPNNSYVLVVGNGEEIAKNIAKFSLSNKVEYFDIYGEKYDPSVKKVPEGITAESVIEKYVEAIGGKENITKITDQTLKFTGSVQGMTINVTMAKKAPNKFYQLVDFGVGQQKTVFDGEKGKASGMGQEVELTGAQLEAMKTEAPLHPYFEYKKMGIKVEVVGIESIEGKDAYNLTVTTPSGKKSTQYYDIESGFMVRTITTAETPQGSFSSTIDMSDYKEVAGVKFPHKLNQSTPMGSIELTATSIEVNTNLPDSMFEVK